MDFNGGKLKYLYLYYPLTLECLWLFTFEVSEHTIDGKKARMQLTIPVYAVFRAAKQHRARSSNLLRASVHGTRADSRQRNTLLHIAVIAAALVPEAMPVQNVAGHPVGSVRFQFWAVHCAGSSILANIPTPAHLPLVECGMTVVRSSAVL